jgi:hypothetical protein
MIAIGLGRRDTKVVRCGVYVAVGLLPPGLKRLNTSQTSTEGCVVRPLNHSGKIKPELEGIVQSLDHRHRIHTND